MQAASTAVALNDGKERPGGQAPAPLVFARYLYSSSLGAWGGRDRVMSVTWLCYYYTHELRVFNSGAANVFALLNVLWVHWVGRVDMHVLCGCACFCLCLLFLNAV